MTGREVTANIVDDPEVGPTCQSPLKAEVWRGQPLGSSGADLSYEVLSSISYGTRNGALLQMENLPAGEHLYDFFSNPANCIFWPCLFVQKIGKIWRKNIFDTMGCGRGRI